MNGEKRLWIIEARDGAWGANGICKGELVRCGECEHKREQKNGQKYCGLHGSHYAMIVTDDWFCADGERRTDEQQS